MSEHDDIRSQLAAYCGDDLDPRERRRVAAHLDECPSCREELAELETTVRLVKSLPPVEPPPGLSGRIMARVREEARPQRRWFERLFMPLHVKLPLEALALVLVCIVSYVGLREIQPQRAAPPAPPSTVAEKSTSEAESPPAAVAPEPAERRAARPAAPMPQPPPAQNAAPPPLAQEASRAATQADATPAPPPTLNEAAPSAAGTAQRSITDTARMEKASVPALQLCLTVTDPDGAEGAIRQSVARAGGSVGNQPAPRRLTIRIDARQWPQLLKELAAIGTLGPVPDVAERSGSLAVTVCW